MSRFIPRSPSLAPPPSLFLVGRRVDVSLKKLEKTQSKAAGAGAGIAAARVAGAAGAAAGEVRFRMS